MIHCFKPFLLGFVLSLSPLMAQQKLPFKRIDSLEAIYQRHQLQGCLIVFDEHRNLEYLFHPEKENFRVSPASTYKIYHSLIGLDAGVLTDTSTLFKWDGKKRSRELLNQDLSLNRAFRYSAVWYYQELARRIGAERMAEGLKKCRYGNQNMAGKLDEFWLNDTLKISPAEQLKLLIELYHSALPFRKEHQEMVKSILFEESIPLGKLFGKTGWGTYQNRDMGWYVGWLESGGNTYYVVHWIASQTADNQQFGWLRKHIAVEALKGLMQP